MEFNLVNIVELLLLPPGGLLLLGGAGLFLLRRQIAGGKGLIAASLIGFYVLSMPLISGALLRSVERGPALAEDRLSEMGAQAIVVLGGGRLYAQSEFGGDTVSSSSLQRLRYAAWLKRRTHLPLYLSGGATEKNQRPEAQLMRDTLQKEFNVQVNVAEEQSKTTYENAKYTAALLKQNGHRKIFLVSSARHLPRAVEAFEKFDIEAVPAPTVFATGTGFSFLDILPQANAFEESYQALHEWFGRLWYAIRYY